MTDPELSEALRELRDAAEIPPAAYAAVRARVQERIGTRRQSFWPWCAGGAAACAAWLLFARLALHAPVPPPPGQVKPLVIAMPAEPPPEAIRPARARRRRPRPAPPAQTLTIKMLTDDPDVVIYWVVDNKGE